MKKNSNKPPSVTRLTEPGSLALRRLANRFPDIPRAQITSCALIAAEKWSQYNHFPEAVISNMIASRNKELSRAEELDKNNNKEDPAIIKELQTARYRVEMLDRCIQQHTWRINND